MDWITLFLAVAGGAANGTFPIFIKTPAVLAANVHPIVFQLYKSSWVAIVGISFVLIRLIRGMQVTFTPWAFASAASWIPSGVSTIIAVPLIGVGSAVLVTAGVGSALSFLVFWLGFHEDIKVHTIGGHEYVFAPWYMLGCLIGMAGLVGAHQGSVRDLARHGDPRLTAVNAASRPLALEDGSSSEEGPSSPVEGQKPIGGSRAHVWRALLGYIAAAVSGVFSSTQFGLVEYGKRETDGAHQPAGSPPDERFDALGSWLGAFGVSAVFCTLVGYALVWCYELTHGRTRPSLQLRVMAAPGSAAGIFWSIANVFSVLAVLRGGNAVTMAQINAASLITSGLWGLLWYREMHGLWAVLWVAAAAFTATMTVLLGFEKGK